VCAWRAPQGSDLRVLEHGSNCLATVDADVVEGETTSDRRSGVVREQACQWGADSARKRTLWGSSALEMGDHRLFEDGSERGGALVSDLVASETASEGWGGDGERVGVSMGADTNKRTLGGGGALERGHRASLERLAELGEACSGVGALSILDATQRVVSQAVSMAKEECQGALTGK
jgi:hypothetical protein